MSERRRRKNPRFLKETSDRSGFDSWHRNDEGNFSKQWQGVKQGGLLLAPEEYDMPPPSNKPLGGADISGSPRANSLTTTIPNSPEYQIQYLVSASQISLITVEDGQVPIMISGSNSAVTLSSNPQIVSAGSNQFIGILCVGSNVTLNSGNGLSLKTNFYVMNSGSILNLRYDLASSTWIETSRDHQYYGIGF